MLGNTQTVRLVLLLSVAAYAGGAAKAGGAANGFLLRVKLLVDEEETRTAKEWQKRLSERLLQASNVISEYAGVRFTVSEFSTWNSDNSVNDLSTSLREFQNEVDPSPARIAIGFTSQYRFQKGRNNMGGTRGPLNPHILIREGAPTIDEPDRIEVLVHELGHFLGAAHSSEPTSVMRPTLGDGRVRRKSVRIRFDSDNAAIIRLVGREVRDRRVRGYHQISLRTKQQMRQHYFNLARKDSSDRIARKYLDVIDRSLRDRDSSSRASSPDHATPPARRPD